LDIPAEFERRQARLDANAAAKARLEERQRLADAQRGRSDDDERWLTSSTIHATGLPGSGHS
jgi:hypothetical protein